MKRIRAMFFAASFASVATMAQAAELQVVDEILSGNSFRLENGQVVQASRLLTPAMPEPGIMPEKEGGKLTAQQAAQKAGQPLAGLVRGYVVELIGPQRIALADVVEGRHPLVYADIHLEDGRWFQGEMLRSGLAMAAPYPGLEKDLPELLALEDAARKAGYGIWAHPYWKVADANADNLTLPHLRYWVAEGTLLRASDSRDGDWYLHFGPDWETDVTAKIRADDYKRHFKKMDMKSLEGKTLRLRGYTYMDQGPMIEIRLPEAIEVLE